MNMHRHCKLYAAFLLVALIGAPLFPASPARADVACTEYTLLWTNPDITQNPGAVPGESVPIGTGGLSKNPVTVTNNKAPDVPTALVGQADWQCTKTNGTTGTLPVDKNSTEGSELCTKAVELSAKFGALTSLDHVQKSVQDTIFGFLQNKISSFTGLNIPLNAKDLIKKGIVVGGKFLGDKFNDIFGNPMKKGIQDQANKIIDKGKKQLEDIAKKYLGDLASKASSAAKNIIGVNTAVPTQESSGPLLDSTKIIEQRTGDIIAEQRHQEIIANRRQECQLLYNKTNETIKNSLLFQLSNQIVDWIQSGKQPQFIKQPGKFLEDTAILAVNRSISQLAPRLCSSFRDQVVVQIPGYSAQTNPFYQPVTCTIDQVVNNVEDFYNNFQSGGWLAYQEIWQPQNNYFGASMLANSLVGAQTSAAVQVAQNDLNQGNGFASKGQCTQWVLYSPTTPGTVTESIMNALLLVGNTYYAPDYSTTQGATDDGNPPLVPANAPTDSHWKCTSAEKTTPGTVAANLTKQASASTLNNLNQTSDVEAFLGTIEDAIINKLVKSGVGGLKSLLKGLPQINL